jgi:cytochrome c oxidase assembly factor CtaG
MDMKEKKKKTTEHPTKPRRMHFHFLVCGYFVTIPAIICSKNRKHLPNLAGRRRYRASSGITHFVANVLIVRTFVRNFLSPRIPHSPAPTTQHPSPKPAA